MTYVFKGAPFVCTKCPGMMCIIRGGCQAGDPEPNMPERCPYTGKRASWTQVDARPPPPARRSP